MENISFRKRVIDMEIGDSITIPVDEVGYTTHRNRAERTHTITRLQ